MVTTAELALLNTQPQQSDLYLSIYQPTTKLACRVNDATIGVGDYQITFDAVSIGAYTNVVSGMTMYVGTTPGGMEKGRVRVKSATSTVITVAENSDIAWADNLYLTVVAFYEVWAVYPRMVQGSDTFTIYKDYDVAYSTQQSVLGSFVCMGGHYAGFLENGVASVYYSASGTYNVKGDALTYAWTFEGAVSGTSTAETPGLINYTTPGHYTTKLIVSNASGGTDTSYRHISIYNNPDVSSANNPIRQWGITNFTGSKDAGGYSLQLWLKENITVKDGSLVVIWAKDYYGNTVQSIGGKAPGRSKIVFSGYILDNSILYDYASTTINFTVGSPSEMMKIREGFSVALNHSASPASWSEVLNLTTARGVYSALRYQSTVLQTNDVRWGASDIAIKYLDTGAESLYDSIDRFLQSTLYAKIICDKQGLVWMVDEPKAIATAYSSLPNGMFLDRTNWIDQIQITETHSQTLGYVELGGFAFDGNYSYPYLSAAPGYTPAYSGKKEERSGLAVTDQSDLNYLAGSVWLHDNARFPSVSIRCAGNYRNLDISPFEIIRLTVSQADSMKSNVVWNQKPFYITAISWQYDVVLKCLIPTLELHEISETTWEGVLVTVPELPLPNFPEQPILDYPVPIVPDPYITFPMPPFVPIPDIPNPGDPSQPGPGTLDCLANPQPTGIMAIPVGKTLYNNTNEAVYLYFPGALRESSGLYATSFSFDAEYQTLSDCATDTWITDPAGNWLDVYVKDCNGTRVADGTIATPTSAFIRNGTFNNPVNVQFCYIELRFQSPKIFRPSNVIASSDYLVDVNTQSWGLTDSGIWISRTAGYINRKNLSLVIGSSITGAVPGCYEATGRMNWVTSDNSGTATDHYATSASLILQDATTTMMTMVSLGGGNFGVTGSAGSSTYWHRGSTVYTAFGVRSAITVFKNDFENTVTLTYNTNIRYRADKRVIVRNFNLTNVC